VVSPAIHDGTPNSLLEGMACGCFPVAGDLESIREWITHGQNGLLVRIRMIRNRLPMRFCLLWKTEDLRRNAAGLNANMISTRAEYGMNMKKVAGVLRIRGLDKEHSALDHSANLIYLSKIVYISFGARNDSKRPRNSMRRESAAWRMSFANP
jgi:hypothetical protein